eukprot:scaffold1342_cov120-Isochrysis_galbana.AAC.2
MLASSKPNRRAVGSSASGSDKRAPWKCLGTELGQPCSEFLMCPSWWTRKGKCGAAGELADAPLVNGQRQAGPAAACTRTAVSPLKGSDGADKNPPADEDPLQCQHLTFNTGCQNVANEAGTKMLMACSEELGQSSNMFSNKNIHDPHRGSACRLPRLGQMLYAPGPSSALTTPQPRQPAQLPADRRPYAGRNLPAASATFISDLRPPRPPATRTRQWSPSPPRRRVLLTPHAPAASAASRARRRPHRCHPTI